MATDVVAPATAIALSGNTFSTAISFRISAKYTDGEIYPSSGVAGLLYYGYRYYQPSTGRWLSRDPVGEHSEMNLYALVSNATIVSVDYLGLEVKGPNQIAVLYKDIARSTRTDYSAKWSGKKLQCWTTRGDTLRISGRSDDDTVSIVPVRLSKDSEDAAWVVAHYTDGSSEGVKVFVVRPAKSTRGGTKATSDATPNYNWWMTRFTFRWTHWTQIGTRMPAGVLVSEKLKGPSGNYFAEAC